MSATRSRRAAGSHARRHLAAMPDLFGLTFGSSARFTASRTLKQAWPAASHASSSERALGRNAAARREIPSPRCSPGSARQASSAVNEVIGASVAIVPRAIRSSVAWHERRRGASARVAVQPVLDHVEVERRPVAAAQVDGAVIHGAEVVALVGCDDFVQVASHARLRPAVERVEQRLPPAPCRDEAVQVAEHEAQRVADLEVRVGDLLDVLAASSERRCGSLRRRPTAATARRPAA